MKKNLPKKSIQPVSPKPNLTASQKPKFWTALEWLALSWICFIVYKVLEQTPLQREVFESILPAQTFFPSLSILFFYLWNIFLWLGMGASCWVLGFTSLQFLKIEWNSSLEQGVFSISCGIGILALFLLLLAGLQLLFQTVLVGLWIAGVIWFFTWLRKAEHQQFFRDFCAQTSEGLFGTKVPFLFRMFLWIFLSLSLLMAHVPELFYDSLVYHLGIPNLYLQEGGLVRIPGNTSRFPLLWQMLYVLGLALSDEMLPKLIHWSSGLLLVLGYVSLAQRLGFESWLGILSGLFFLSIPMAQMNLWTTGIDVGSCLFSFLAIYAALTALSKNQDSSLPKERMGWVALSAVMAGFAYGSKYQGGILAVNLFLVLIGFQIVKEKEERYFWLKSSLLFSSIIFLTVLPWLAKNFWDTGNPFFPFLSGLFERLSLQKESIEPWQYQHFVNENRRFIGLPWQEIWKLPWKLTFEWNQSSLSNPGPLFLAFLPVSLLSFQKIKNHWLQFIFVFLLLFFTFAFSSTHLTRYHLQGYPMLCFFYALGFYLCWMQRSFLWRLSLGFLLSLVFLENLQTGIFIIQNSYRPWEVLSGRESREDYRAYTHPGLNPYPSNAMFRWMEKNLSRKTRTLLIGESKNFDLKLPYLYTDVHGENPLVRWTEESSTPEELYEKLKAFGITHLFINFTEARRTYDYKMIQWKPDSLKKFKLFWEKHVRELHRELIPERFFQSNGILLLYEVLPEEAARLAGSPPVNPLLVLEEMKRSQG